MAAYMSIYKCSYYVFAILLTSFHFSSISSVTQNYPSPPSSLRPERVLPDSVVAAVPWGREQGFVGPGRYLPDRLAQEQHQSELH